MDKLAFTKDWTNPADFSAYEPDGTKVRADQQLLFDETKDFINMKVIDVLEALDLENVPHSSDILAVRLNADNAIEVTLDGTNWEATGSSGHVILDKNGAVMTQRSRMKFANCTISDDGTVTIINGIKGDMGDVGPVGITGPQGIIGPTGLTGKSIIPAVNPTTGLMSFSEGESGAIPSPVYVLGPQGAQGVQGNQGVPGVQGSQGSKGDTGSQGAQGIQGLQGSTGPTGSQGVAGTAGAQGPTGPQGQKGDDGADGSSFTVLGLYATLYALQTAHPAGSAGQAYAVGTAANNVIYNWSVDTTAWISLGALQGPTGAQGIQGIQGIQGATGADGAAGAKGDTGLQGIQGIQGIQGTAGPNTVSTATATNITGVLKGNGANVGQAVAGTDYQVPVTTQILGTLINGATAKTVPVDADYIPLMDSATGNIMAKLSWAYVKSVLNTFFLSNTQTLTNKRITKRTTTITSSATPGPTGDATDMMTITAQAAGATIAAPTGTPTNGQELFIRIKDNGTAQTLAWNVIYRGVGVTLPATTVLGKTMYCWLLYNSTDTKWDLCQVCIEGVDLAALVAAKAPTASPTFTGTVAGITAAMVGAAPLRYTTTTVTTSSTIDITQANTRLLIDSASAIAINIPLNSVVGFTVGDEIELVQYGAGTVSITGTAGVTIDSKNSYKVIGGQYSSVVLTKLATDEWLLSGSLVSA